MKTYIFIVVLAFYFSSNLLAQKQQFPYQNPKLSVEERVNDLLSRMSLEEMLCLIDKYKQGDPTIKGIITI